MEIGRARYLVSEEGRAALATFASLDTSNPLRLSHVLRRSLVPEAAAAVAEQLTLRNRARARFGEPGERLLFTARGLEMMSHPLVAERRARRLGPGLTAIDVTCGLGGDLGPLAKVAPAALGLERDPATAVLASANVPEASITIGDATRPPVDLSPAAVMLDPSRRTGHARTFNPNAFSPPWDACLDVARAAKRAVIKGPPGIPHAAIPEDAEVEFVQVGRGLREAALWFGRGAAPGVKRAVLLPVGAELESRTSECEADPVRPRAFLIDPESCVTRAGLVRHLGDAIGARLIDPNVAYLTADEPVASPLAACFEVLDRVDFSVARLRAVLRSRGWRADEIRRRAFPVEPDELRRLLGPTGDEPVSLLCTTVSGKRLVFVCRGMRPGENCATV